MIDKIISRAGFKKDTAWAKFMFLWLFLGFSAHLIAAVRSSGFYFPDEHFQLVEWVNFKLGGTAISDLSTPFEQRLQPWLLPAVFTGLTQFLNALGNRNPFEWALAYRIIAALLGWISASGLCLCCYVWFEEKQWRRWAVMAINLTWYLPAFHARHSTQNIGGSLFFIALSLLILGSSPQPKHPEQPAKCSPGLAFSVGLLLGLAFECQFSLITLILGFGVWLVGFARIHWKSFSMMGCGLLVPLGLGALADHWGYGQWTFPPWNSFQNQWIALASGYALGPVFGLSSIGTIFQKAFLETWPPLGALAALSVVMAWIRNPKHLLTWTTCPLAIVTLAQAYFLRSQNQIHPLLPIAHAGGILFSLSLKPKLGDKGMLEVIKKKFQVLWTSLALKKSLKLTAAVLFGINLLQFALLTTLPAWMPIPFLSTLYQFKPYGFEINYKDSNFLEIDGKPLNFYRPPHVNFNQFSEFSEFTRNLVKKESAQWLFYPQARLPDDAQQLKDWCKQEFSILPKWLSTPIENETLKKVTPLSSSFSNWTLYKCQSPNFLKSTLEEFTSKNRSSDKKGTETSVSAPFN